MRSLALVMLVACNGNPATQPAPTVPQAVPTASRDGATAPPTFVYAEAHDELTFWAPTTLRLVRASGRVCNSELSTGADNMWTGPDVEAALAHPDVHAVLARGGTAAFLPEIDDAGVIVEGTLRAGSAVIEWRMRPCHWCVAPPAGITQLRSVLVGVMLNRRLLCP